MSGHEPWSIAIRNEHRCALNLIRSAVQKKNPTSRQIATLCLTAWHKQKGPIGPIADSIIHGSGLLPVDRHLAVNLVQGVLRQMQYLDTIITRYSKFSLGKMKPLTIMALRVGVFQIIFLERIPESAAVNETVKVMKLERQPRWLQGFINGVLRNIVRNRDKLPKPDAFDTREEVPLNHPQWLVQRWQDRYGVDLARAICRVNNKEPLLTLRVNTLRIKTGELAELFRQQGHEVRLGKYAADALVLESVAGPIVGLPGFEEGLFHVQDEAAQLVASLLGPFDNLGRYVDGCAGLGGKTCQLAQLISGQSELFAVEPSARRIRLLEENLQRLRLNNVTLYRGRLDAFNENAAGLFNGVLIDAPCSGTGVIRRQPDIRWNRCREDLLTYQKQQLELLAQGASLVKPGGCLVYATCSIEPEENTEVITAFLQEHSEFTVTDCRQYLPENAAPMVTAEGFFAPTPADGMDGFFGARLELTQSH